LPFLIFLKCQRHWRNALALPSIAVFLDSLEAVFWYNCILIKGLKMQENKFRELLQGRKATRAKPISFESTADDMTRIIEYAKTKEQKASTLGSEKLFQLPRLHQQKHRFEIRVDGISDVFDGTIDQAQKRLAELSTNHSC